jgi:LmbE family N-acetylglucosaminyl deacetylase
MSSIKPGTALMFDPHPDDADFWSGGLSLLLRQIGWEVHYACCGETDTVTRAQARAAAKVAGVHRHFLEIPLTGNSRLRDDLRQKIVPLMQKLQPKLTFTTALTDYHQEHCDLTREILPLLRAYRRFKFPETEIYLYDSHDGRDPVEIYIDITGVFDKHMEALRCHKVFEKPGRFPPGDNTLTRVKTGRTMSLGASIPHAHTRCLYAEGYRLIWGDAREVSTLKLLFPDKFYYRSPNWLTSMWYT